MGWRTVASVVGLWVVSISIMVNRVVPDPYMDEIFHIPQAQNYCRGELRSWDPMITTPPGLYYISLAYVASFFPGMWLLRTTSSMHDICSTPFLRSVNGVLAIVCSILIYEILIRLKPASSEKKATIYAIIISLYPVHWFFSFLYYTDVASVTAVLATYFACLKQKYWISAVFGAMAVLFRQTNVVWIGFIAATTAIEYAEILYGKQSIPLDGHNIAVIQSSGMLEKRTTENQNLRRRRRWESSKHSNSSNISGINNGPSSDKLGIFDEFLDAFLKLWCLKWRILASFSPFMMVFISFVAFVTWNGSIVLGAKEAHVISPHFAQIMYVGLVCAAAVAPVHFSTTQARFIFKSFSEQWLLWLTALVFGFIGVHFFSIAHPYLLADNRHYTFYIWRRIINLHWTMKYLLVPLYVYSWFSIISVLGKHQKKIWIFLFFLACAAVLIPAPLLEFRYYTIPFLFLVLHSRIEEDTSWVLISVLYVAANIFTMVMFLFQPFHWPHEPGTQRFIW